MLGLFLCARFCTQMVNYFLTCSRTHVYDTKNKPAYRPTYSKNYAIYITTNILYCYASGVNKN